MNTNTDNPKNNAPRYLLVEFRQAEQAQTTSDENVLVVSSRLISQNRSAYQELAK